jgi:hypothetical protein
MTETCGTCRWFALAGFTGIENWEDGGLCQFAPPSGPLIYSVGDVTINLTRPVTFCGFTCSEHQPITPPETTP